MASRQWGKQGRLIQLIVSVIVCTHHQPLGVCVGVGVGVWV